MRRSDRRPFCSMCRCCWRPVSVGAAGARCRCATAWRGAAGENRRARGDPRGCSGVWIVADRRRRSRCRPPSRISTSFRSLPAVAALIADALIGVRFRRREAARAAVMIVGRRLDHGRCRSGDRCGVLSRVSMRCLATPVAAAVLGRWRTCRGIGRRAAAIAEWPLATLAADVHRVQLPLRRSRVCRRSSDSSPRRCSRRSSPRAVGRTIGFGSYDYMFSSLVYYAASPVVAVRRRPRSSRRSSPTDMAGS